MVASIWLAVAPPAAAAVTAQTYPSYAPTDPKSVVAQVARRDPRELAMRAALREDPERVDLATELARADIQRARALQDPRYLGRAQATLARWWAQDDPPPDVLLLRATIRQSLHDFTGARADLDRLIGERPDDAQAQLTLAVVATVTADYPTARQGCARVAELAAPLVATTCIAQIDGVTGHAEPARQALAAELARGGVDPALRGWAETALAELSIVRGDYAAAAAQLHEVLALDPDDAYGRAALADVLMWTGHPADASALLAGREMIDNLLVRRAIAEHAAHGPAAQKLAQAMRDRIAAAAERGDRVHLREHAMFELEVEGDARRALALALDDWAVQKELADARIVAAAAWAAGDPASAEPVRAWARANGVEDVQLAQLLGGAP
ncbi:MAG TPA: tetratricopeptide repeat protein [Kofleriaceae bacterium]|nr:tetratricopeptide repeat protein [Kofleriaceae bacterium]